MEQDQEVRGLEQVEAQGKVALAGDGEVVLQQDREVFAFVPIVVKKHPISWAAPVMSKNVLNAEPQ